MRLKLIIAALAVALLSACAGMQVSTSAVALAAAAVPQSKLGGGVFGTLATNPCEAATAAGYTAVVVAANKIEKRMLSRAWSPDRAQPAIDLSRQALQLLDGACPSKTTVDPVALGLATERLLKLKTTMEALDAGQ